MAEFAQTVLDFVQITVVADFRRLNRPAPIEPLRQGLKIDIGSEGQIPALCVAGLARLLQASGCGLFVRLGGPANRPSLACAPVGGDALTLIAGITKVRLWVFLLLVGSGKALRYVSVVYLMAWPSS